MTRKLSYYNTRIKTLTSKNKKLNKENKELKLIVSQNENNVSIKEFVDMRFRAQKAELALEALALANVDNQVTTNMKKYKILEEVKTLLEKFIENGR